MALTDQDRAILALARAVPAGVQLPVAELQRLLLLERQDFAQDLLGMARDCVKSGEYVQAVQRIRMALTQLDKLIE